MFYGGVAASEDDSGTGQAEDVEVALYCTYAPLNPPLRTSPTEAWSYSEDAAATADVLMSRT